MHHHEDAKVDVEEGGEEGQREHAGRDREEAPEEVQQRPAVAHAALVIAGVTQQLVVGGQHPGERQEGAQRGDACRGRETEEGVRRLQVSGWYIGLNLIVSHRRCCRQANVSVSLCKRRGVKQRRHLVRIFYGKSLKYIKTILAS